MGEPYAPVVHAVDGRGKPKLTDRGAYLPTPEEIEEECRLLRTSWSKREERSRAGAYRTVRVRPVDETMCEAPDDGIGGIAPPALVRGYRRKDGIVDDDTNED